MSVFVDTNILLRSVQPSHPLYEAAVNSVASFIAEGTPLMVTPQIVAEYRRAAASVVAIDALVGPNEPKPSHNSGSIGKPVSNAA